MTTNPDTGIKKSMTTKPATETTKSAKKSAKEEKVPKVLSFERKLSPSDALFYGGSWANIKSDSASDWQPLVVQEKTILGTISNRQKSSDTDSAKLLKDIQNNNIQTVDFVMLPQNSDTLRTTFTLRVLSDAGTPSACTNLSYRGKLLAATKAYAETHGFTELANRYAHNLINGRFTWRNAFCAEQMQVTITHRVLGEPNKQWSFNSLDFSKRKFDVPAEHQAAFNEVATLIKEGLQGKRNTLLEITAFVQVGIGQEVFPSQEMVMEKKSKKSKTLYSVGGVAAFHSQKIGNAIRTIDTWHSEAATLGPIAVEPFGTVTSLGSAFRKPKDKNDFYTLFDNWLLADVAPTAEEQHFMMAVLIRGGVFGGGEDKKKEKDQEDDN